MNEIKSSLLVRCNAISKCCMGSAERAHTRNANNKFKEAENFEKRHDNAVHMWTSAGVETKRYTGNENHFNISI